jgi:phosphoserine aminotransferase
MPPRRRSPNALDFAKLDVTTFSWQKALGGEAAHGMLVLSPRAVERLESYVPPRPLPKIFRLTKSGRLNRAIFEGETINTPSMLCVEDWIVALQWAASLGGLPALIARADANAARLDRWVRHTPWIDHLAADPATRSNTSVCLKLADAVTARLDEAERAPCRNASPSCSKAKTWPTTLPLSRCAAGLAHLVRRHRRGGRHRGADPVARLGL